MTSKKTKNDSFIIPTHKKVKVINADDNNIIFRLGELRRNQREQKEISNKAHGELVQISKELNEILEELSLR
jgi:hypothetical protein